MQMALSAQTLFSPPSVGLPLYLFSINEWTLPGCNRTREEQLALSLPRLVLATLNNGPLPPTEGPSEYCTSKVDVVFSADDTTLYHQDIAEPNGTSLLQDSQRNHILNRGFHQGQYTPQVVNPLACSIDLRVTS